MGGATCWSSNRPYKVLCHLLSNFTLTLSRYKGESKKGRKGIRAKPESTPINTIITSNIDYINRCFIVN